jgi:hypothetical protein
MGPRKPGESFAELGMGRRTHFGEQADGLMRLASRWIAPWRPEPL